MALVHEAAFSTDPEQIIFVEDAFPLRSARLFKFISDEVWSHKPEQNSFTSFCLKSAINPVDAIILANEIAGSIDERLVLANGTKDLSLGADGSEKVIIPARDLEEPRHATLETFNWDYTATGRLIKVGNSTHGVSFTDGHKDYARELSANFTFDCDGVPLIIDFKILRSQQKQGQLTNLSTGFWYGEFTENGYEENSQHQAEMTEDQEIEMLSVFSLIGGIATTNFS